MLYDKHKKALAAPVSRPNRGETEGVRRLNAQRDLIRQQQAEREAARKVRMHVTAACMRWIVLA